MVALEPTRAANSAAIALRLAEHPQSAARGVWLCLFCALLGSMLTGCGSGAADLPSLEEGDARPQNPVDIQRRGAEAFYSCMNQAGVMVSLENVNDGQAVVEWVAKEQAIYLDREGSIGTVTGPEASDSEPAWSAEANERIAAASPGEVILFIDGADYSSEYAQCLESTNYAAPEIAIDRKDELQYKQETVEVSNDWAACARENGFPETVDAEAPTGDDWQTMPSVLLPATITPEQFRLLLESCPSFDVEAARAADRRTAAGAEDVEWPRRANIEFDFPPAPAGSTSAPVAPEYVERRRELLAVLLEERERLSEGFSGVLPPLDVVRVGSDGRIL